MADHSLRRVLEGRIFRALIWICLATVLMALAMQALITTGSVRAALRSDAEIIGDLLGERMDAWTRTASALASMLQSGSCEDWECRSQILANAGSLGEEYFSALTTDARGVIVGGWASPGRTQYPADRMRDLSVADRDYFTAPRSNLQPYISGVFEGRGLGTDRIVAASVPLLDAAGDFIGIVEISVANVSFAPAMGLMQARAEGYRRMTITDARGNELYRLGGGTNAAREIGFLAWVFEPINSALTASHVSRHGYRVNLQGSFSQVISQMLGTAHWLLVAAILILLAVRKAARDIAEQTTEPLKRIEQLIERIDDPTFDAADWSNTPSSAWREANDIGNALVRASARTRSALEKSQATSHQLAKANAELAVAVDERDGYIERQTKRLQDALSNAWQASEAKSRLLANTSHELRTPLNGIVGSAELLLRSKPLSLSQKTLLNMQLDSAQGLLTLVNDILELGRNDLSQSIVATAFDVVEEARLVCGTLRAVADQRHIGLRLEISPEFHPFRMGDRARFRQVLMGLVGNAIKFTEQGAVEVLLSDTDTLELKLEVKDSGIGIPAGVFDRVFEPFFQVDSATTRKQKGTGLGLAIVKELVSGMGGRVTLQSELGKGSKFEVLLPFEFAQAEDLAQPKPIEESFAPLSDLRVIVVDDVEMNRELLEMQLQSLGCTVSKVDSGEQLLEFLAQHATEVDLILLDCQMPIMDGYTAAQSVRATYAGLPLRIVAVTAHAQPDERERCVSCGMDDYVSKPVSMATLTRVLQEAALMKPR